MYSKIDEYLEIGCMRCPLGATSDCRVHNWTEELKLLREIILDTGLKEEHKWGVPCYTFNDKNVIILSALKETCTLSFFKGALLNDENNLLVKPGKNSQAARLFKFKNSDEIKSIQGQIKEYIFEAIEIEKSGLKIEYQKNPEPIPEELENFMEKDPIFKSAFEALTPGRQRGYIIYFSAAKQPKTRVSRIEKSVSKILNGVGLNDKYSGRRN